MSVINFPSTDPADPDYSDFHQQNGYTWEWDGTAWRVSGRPQLVLPPGTTVGSLPPSTPVNGQVWFNTQEYNLYMFVIDPDTSASEWQPVMRLTTFYTSTEPTTAVVGDLWFNTLTRRTLQYCLPDGWIEINEPSLAVQSTSAGQVFPDATMNYNPNTGEFGMSQIILDQLDEIDTLKQEIVDIKAHLGI
jgi:hypothetical protein